MRTRMIFSQKRTKPNLPVAPSRDFMRISLLSANYDPPKKTIE